MVALEVPAPVLDTLPETVITVAALDILVSVTLIPDWLPPETLPETEIDVVARPVWDTAIPARLPETLPETAIVVMASPLIVTWTPCWLPETLPSALTVIAPPVWLMSMPFLPETTAAVPTVTSTELLVPRTSMPVYRVALTVLATVMAIGPLPLPSTSIPVRPVTAPVALMVSGTDCRTCALMPAT